MRVNCSVSLYCFQIVLQCRPLYLGIHFMLHVNELVQHGQQTTTLLVDERLPVFITSPCELTVNYQVMSEADFYLIHLTVIGKLTIACQRCMNEFELMYDNDTVIAVCKNDKRAEELLEHYECVVAPKWQVNLHDLVIDELHLYVPQFHQEINDCDDDVNQILTTQNETY